MRAPRLGQLAQLLFARPLVHSQQSADRDLHGEVAGRPDIRPPLGEQKIDFRRPAADALDPGQQRDRLVVVFGQVGEVELARQDQRSKAARVARLLPRYSRRSQ